MRSVELDRAPHTGDDVACDRQPQACSSIDARSSPVTRSASVFPENGMTCQAIRPS